MRLLELHRMVRESKEDFIASKQGDNLARAFEANNDMSYIEGVFGAQPDALMAMQQQYENNPGLFVIKYLKRADPTNTKYLQWLANQYINRHFKLEDIPRVTTALSTFHQYKNQFPRKDISQYKKLSDLEEVIMTLRPKDKASKKKAKQQEKLQGADLLMKGSDGMIIVVKTHKAACHYGKNTKWCTTRYDGYHFNSYNKQGPIFIFIGKDNTRYQMHFPSHQFKDATNHDFDMDQARAEYPTLDKFFRAFRTIRETDTNYYSLALADANILYNIKEESASYDEFLRKWKSSDEVTVADPKMFDKAMDILMDRVVLRQPWSEKEIVSSKDDLIKGLNQHQFRDIFIVSLYQWLKTNGIVINGRQDYLKDFDRISGIAMRLDKLADDAGIRRQPISGPGDYKRIFSQDIDAIAKSFIRR